jgi:tetratricopeptide (TPR) repeat protein
MHGPDLPMKPETGRGILIFFLVVLVSCTFAQSPENFKSALRSATRAEKRIPLLKEAGEWYLKKRDTAALRYIEELVKLSGRSKDPVLRAYAYYRMGVCRYQQNDIRRSTSLYFQGLEHTHDLPEFDDMRARLYNGVGWNFSLLGKNESALRYFRQAESYASPDNPQLVGLILNNRGVAYKNLDRHDSALVAFEHSLVQNRKISDQRQTRFNLNNIGSVLMALMRFKESREYLYEALTLNSTAGDTVEIINNLINLSLINIHEDSLEKAEVQLTRARSMAKAIHSLDQQRRVYFSLTSISESQKKYEQALHFQKAYYKLTDSLYRKEGIEHSLKAEAKYMNLEKENELQEAREHVVEQRFYLSIIIGALLITFIVIFFLGRLVRTRKTNEQELLKLNAEIQKQSQELLAANKAITEANEALEQLVKYRTEVIQNQSKRLSHFSFVNSHEIRGPLATLMGLLGLLYEEKSPEKSKQILGFLKITSAKLDKIIRSVSRELEKENEEK